MKISGRKPTSGPSSTSGPASKKSGQDGADKVDRSDAAEPSVGVDLSPTSQVVSSARAAIDAMPDVRMDRVSEIRLSVDDGSYQVQSEELARRMVDESLRESAHRTKKD